MPKIIMLKYFAEQTNYSHYLHLDTSMCFPVEIDFCQQLEIPQQRWYRQYALDLVIVAKRFRENNTRSQRRWQKYFETHLLTEFILRRSPPLQRD